MASRRPTDRLLFASASAARRREVARARIEEALDARGAVTLVGATSAAALALGRELAFERAALAGLEPTTLFGLARRLAAPSLAAQGEALAEPPLLAALVGEALEQRVALGRFERARALPGTPIAIARVLDELWLADVDDATLGELDPALAAIARAVRARLGDERLVTRGAVLERARAALDEAAGPPRDLVVLDATLEATLEARFARALVERAPRVTVTLPSAATSARARWLEIAGPCEAREEASPSSDPPATVASVDGSSVEDECAVLVRSLLRELGREPAVALDRCAFVLFDEARYRTPLLRALARAHVPVRVELEVQRPDRRGRAFLALLDCASHARSTADLAEYLALAPARRQRPQGLGDAPTDDEPTDDEEDATRSALESDEARRGAALLDRLARLDPLAPFRAQRAQLEALARDALDDPQTVLDALAWLDASLRGTAREAPIALEELTRRLTPRLLHTPARALERDLGVTVLSVDALAGRAFELTLAPGLVEGRLPRRVLEDPILDDEARARLSARAPSDALPLATTATRQERERAVLRALFESAPRLIVSHPLRDERGRALFAARWPPSASAEPRADASSEPPRSERFGAPRRPEDALDQREADLATIAELLDARGPSEPRGRARYLVEGRRALLRALRARYHANTSAWRAPDGAITRERAELEVIAASPARSGSVEERALATFVVCPYRFFLHEVVGLRPDEPSLDERSREPIDPARVRAAISAALEGGFFPRAPEPGACARCEVRLVCGLDAEERALHKKADPRMTPLLALRRAR